MDYVITSETFTSLASYEQNSRSNLKWNSLFTLPAWLNVWWRHFQNGRRLYIVSVKSHNEVIGLAPLQISDHTACLLGDPDVCDFVDFTIRPGEEDDFFSALLEHLAAQGITGLELGHVRPDSTVFATLRPLAERRGWRVSCTTSAVSLEMELPASFEEYLETLTGKQRHEVRRKMRRLEETGEIAFRSLNDWAAIKDAMPVFFRLFSESRSDKAAFMTDRMKSFFEDFARAMSGVGLIRLGILELDRKPVAVVIYFDYSGVRYLYNSGYDPGYGDLSAGLLSKVLCIKDAIESGLKRFDFLKGAEPYKYRLGGTEIPLYTCLIRNEK